MEKHTEDIKDSLLKTEDRVTEAKQELANLAETAKAYSRASEHMTRHPSPEGAKEVRVASGNLLAESESLSETLRSAALWLDMATSMLRGVQAYVAGGQPELMEGEGEEPGSDEGHGHAVAGLPGVN